MNRTIWTESVIVLFVCWSLDSSLLLNIISFLAILFCKYVIDAFIDIHVCESNMKSFFVVKVDSTLNKSIVSVTIHMLKKSHWITKGHISKLNKQIINIVWVFYIKHYYTVIYSTSLDLDNKD